MEHGTKNYRRFRETGDETGLVEVIREYKNGLMLYLNTFVGNLDTAEELAIDTFALLGTKKPADKGKGSFKTWLYTIGRNLAIDFLRQRERRHELPLEDYVEMPDEGQNLLASYIKEEQKLRLHQAMAKLKPEYRQVLWLRFFEDLSGKEAAAVMKKSVHATEMLLSRAKKELKNELEREGFTYEE